MFPEVKSGHPATLGSGAEGRRKLDAWERGVVHRVGPQNYSVDGNGLAFCRVSSDGQRHQKGHIFCSVRWEVLGSLSTPALRTMTGGQWAVPLSFRTRLQVPQDLPGPSYLHPCVFPVLSLVISYGNSTFLSFSFKSAVISLKKEKWLHCWHS